MVMRFKRLSKDICDSQAGFESAHRDLAAHIAQVDCLFFDEADTLAKLGKRLAQLTN